MAGTSQASPHVAGAVAVLRAAFPADTLDQSAARMTSSGVLVTDPRNGISKPRLNLIAAIGSPTNDMFSTHAVINGDTGQLSSNNLNASREAGEPNHAGGTGSKSVWWNWTPQTTGVASIDTHGSNFDTLLAVYTGTVLNNLDIVAANDNDGFIGNTSGVSFVAQAGTTYQIAVDGSNGATGLIKLNWMLEQQADLTLAMSGPNYTVFTDETTAYDLVITNNGPSPASGVTIVDNMPAGSIIESLPTSCTETSGTVNCSLGTLLPGGNAAARIMLHFSTPGDYLNSAQASAATRDPVLANNNATLSVTTIPAQAVPVPGLPLPMVGVTVLALTFLAARKKSETI
jgi:uncharacterized repeat protein (TIGR01451 family)